MKNKVSTIFRTIETNKYRMIFEGACTGILAGLLVSLFRLSLQKAEALRGTLFSAISGNPGMVMLYAGILLISFIILNLCVKFVPLCGGSGIPQVKGELLGQMQQPWYQVIIAKFVGGVCAIGSGLSLGREGPSIQLGAMVGKGFAKLTGKVLTEEKMLMTCGAGAGLSGAFCAPLAGVVFSLEELHKNFSTEILLSTMAASVSADFVSSYLFGLNPVFDLHVGGRLPLDRYWMVILMGLILGCFGVFYNYLTATVQNLYGKVPKRWLKILIPYLLAVILAFSYPLALGSGHSLVGMIAEGDFVFKALAVMLVIKLLFSVISFGSGVPGGIFLPLLVLGSICGGAFSLGMSTVTGYSETYLANFVILGMTGLFASIVRSPITGVILITEMTGDFNNFLPLAMVALISYLTADILHGKPIYDQLLERMLKQNDPHGMTEENKGKKIIFQSDVYIGSLMDGLTVDRMLLPKGCLIVSVERDGKEFVPNGRTALKGGDKLTLLCAQGDVKKVEEKLENICKTIRQ